MDTYERLLRVHARIIWLENKRSRIYGARYDMIKDGSVGPDPVFSSQNRSVEEELYDLWEEKRLLLSKLSVPEELSWMSPSLSSSGVSPRRLQTSKKKEADFRLLSSTQNT